MKSEPKKILICEDHQIVIDGLISLFKNQPDFHVLGYVKNGEDVLPEIRSNTPDVILLDLNLPNKNGIEILKEIKSTFQNVKVIILTMYNSEGIIKKVIKHKGDGFLLKNCSSTDLFTALDSVFENSSFYTGKGVRNNVTETDGFLDKIKLTRREKEIIKEISQGKNVPQIAEKLFISTYTVETHKKNIFKKLDVHNSIDLVKLVNEKQLL